MVKHGIVTTGRVYFRGCANRVPVRFHQQSADLFRYSAGLHAQQCSRITIPMPHTCDDEPRQVPVKMAVEVFRAALNGLFIPGVMFPDEEAAIVLLHSGR